MWREQRFGLEGVDAGVDFAIPACSGASDFCSTMASTSSPPAATADDAAVTGGVGRLGREDGHRRLMRQVKIADSGDCLGPDERHISGEHQHGVVGGERLAALHQGVSGAKLLALFDEADVP